MKQNFGSLIKKESTHILRDKRTMLIVMLIPVVLMVLFGFAISTEVNNINIAIVAPERTDGVNDAVQRLDNNDYFTFKGYISPMKSTTTFGRAKPMQSSFSPLTTTDAHY